MIRSRLERYLNSSENQLSFKKGVGTESCVFLLKENIRSYIRRGSVVHCAFLDASKAFDRVNHTKLFEKLRTRGIPTYLLYLLRYWYRHQRMCVKWNGRVSDAFYVTNGVRQGSLLSPLLFSLYMDDLSIKLNRLKIGLCTGSNILNHLFYADDLTIISPSLFGLRALLNICEDYALDFDITFNPSKSVCMRFHSRSLDFKPGIVTLNDSVLQWSEYV